MARMQLKALVVTQGVDIDTLAGQVINVYKAGTLTPITDNMYTTRTGSTLVPGNTAKTLTSDSSGYITAWIDAPGTDVGMVKTLRLYSTGLGLDQEEQLIPLGTGITASLTSTITVTASVTDTTVVTYTIPANTVVAGSFYRLRIYGDCDCPSDASPTDFPIKLKLGATTLVTTSIAVPTTSARTGQAYEAELVMTVRSIATPTLATVIAQARSLNELTGTLAGALDLAANTTTTTFDSTADTALAVTIACGEATSGYVIRAYHGTVEVVTP